MYKLLLVTIFFLTSMPAQILECIMIDNPKLGLQLANYQYEKLRSKNGTVYNKAGESADTIVFTAMTELGFETIQLGKKPEYENGVGLFRGMIKVAYKNGVNTGDSLMICYDLVSMNNLRAKKGDKESPVAVKDW